MNYNPKDAVQCLPAGWYDAVIANCVEEQAKSSGADMVKVTYKVYAGASERTIYDYIVFPKGTWRLKKLCKALGLLAEFDNQMVTPQLLLNRNVRVELVIEEDDQYGDKNRVHGWEAAAMTARTAAAANAAKPTSKVPVPAGQKGYEPIGEDDIPF